MERVFDIARIPPHAVDKIVRAANEGLFDMGCAWKWRDGSLCKRDVQFRCTETRHYAGKRGERELISFLCEDHALVWAKMYGPRGAAAVFPLLAAQLS